jgi:glutamate-1-semialdehyde 2,1-aminomutase
MSPAARPIDSVQLGALFDREREIFARGHPRSRALFERGRGNLLRGVPMSWMSEWHGGFPIYLDEAHGALLTDVDGITYIDFCLGDTGALAGHAAEATRRAVEARFSRGATAMLPTEDAAWVGAELARRFGLPVWQFALSATDANRWVLRLARELSGRRKILVFNGCYHGTVDENVVTLDAAGRPSSRPGNIGAAVDPTLTTEIVEFNDLEALEQRLAAREIACVLTEPALTNAAGIIPPDPGFHDALRELTAETGTFLALDETQTFPTGPGGYCGAHGLSPDFLTIGKAIAGGVPLGAYGMSEEIAAAITERNLPMGDIGAVGGTLAGNALSLAAARATLGEVLTDEAHQQMNALATRFAAGVRAVFASRELPWHLVQIGSRLEYRYTPTPPRNATEAVEALDEDLDAYLHLFLLNHGVLLTPFHNMALISPATEAAQVDRHTEVFAAAVDSLRATTSRSEAHPG